MQFYAAELVTAIMLVVDCTYFGVCWYIEALIDDLSCMIRELDLIQEPNRLQKMEIALKEIIIFHCKIIG